MEQKENSTFKPKGEKDWDKKAINISKRIYNSIYNNELISKIDFNGCNTLLDVGCGVGNISLIAAKKLKKVYSLDFSSVMLKYLNIEVKKRNITNINTINLSWEESWKNIPNCDIVIASRSMEVKNMKEALEKLNSKANKRVYLTYKVGGSFLNDDILKYIGKKINKKPDYIYTVNILYKMGINASVSFIKSEGKNRQYTDKESFVKSIIWSIGELSSKEKELLRKYYDKNIKDIKQDEDFVCWAVISWDKKNTPCL
jgi:cyclopropane fatty-acyl-phospholipid synthase-like methyltransferase